MSDSQPDPSAASPGASDGARSGATSGASSDAPTPLPEGGEESTQFLDAKSYSRPGETRVGGDGTPTEIATFGAGCFWCVEAVFEQIEGVLDVRSGYMGGHVENPTYEQVCGKKTGHAEVVEVTFDPRRLAYARLVEHFWHLHDPTTLNRQGGDVGPQYRSAIFYHSEAQRETAEASKSAANASGDFDDPIVTEITAASTFWTAEGYHQDYYRLNRRMPYCQVVIAPKLRKLGLRD